jgi:hypothetical protein
MSQENVGIVRQSMEAFNARGLSAALEFWSPDVVWHTDLMVPEPGVYEGKEAVTTYLQGFLRALGRGASIYTVSSTSAVKRFCRL